MICSFLCHFFVQPHNLSLTPNWTVVFFLFLFQTPGTLQNYIPAASHLSKITSSYATDCDFYIRLWFWCKASWEPLAWTPFRIAKKSSIAVRVNTHTHTHKAAITKQTQSHWWDKCGQTMLNWHTDGFSSRQFSSNHFPWEAAESTAQFWDMLPSGWGDLKLDVSQFL